MYENYTHNTHTRIERTDIGRNLRGASPNELRQHYGANFESTRSTRALGHQPAFELPKIKIFASYSYSYTIQRMCYLETADHQRTFAYVCVCVRAHTRTYALKCM